MGAKKAIFAGVFAVFLATPAISQKTDPLVLARDRFENCVWGASVNDWLLKRDFNMAVEQAFSACATEERALTALALQIGGDIAQVEALVIGFKLNLKDRITNKFRAAKP